MGKRGRKSVLHRRPRESSAPVDEPETQDPFDRYLVTGGKVLVGSLGVIAFGAAVHSIYQAFLTNWWYLALAAGEIVAGSVILYLAIHGPWTDRTARYTDHTYSSWDSVFDGFWDFWI